MRLCWELGTWSYSSGSQVKFSQGIVNSGSCSSGRAWWVYNCGAGHCTPIAGVGSIQRRVLRPSSFLYQEFQLHLPVLNPGDAPKVDIGQKSRTGKKLFFFKFLKCLINLVIQGNL